ncbi:hypothetical protein KXW36_009163, partial [Aspergillus fumigatus]
FRDTQSGREAKMHHRPIAYAQTCREVRRIQDRAHLHHDQVTDKLLIVALDGDGVDLTDLLQSRRHLVFNVAHERLDRGKAQIAGGGSIAALALDVTKKVQDQCRVELFDKKLRGFCLDALRREGEQEPEAEAGDQRSKEGHMGSPMINVSAAAAMSVISSGVACRQRDEVSGDRVALGVALLQNMRREAMAKVMNARPPGPLRSNIRKPQDTAECIVHRAGGESLALRRGEQVI